jgi:hypothetical protein
VKLKAGTPVEETGGFPSLDVDAATTNDVADVVMREFTINELVHQ